MSYGGGYGGPSDRREDKQTMQRNNDRFAQYIQKVRRVADTEGPNSLTFVNLFKNLEDECNANRKMYERELDDLSNELMAAKNEKNAYKAEAEKYKKLAQELDDRLRAAEDSNRQLKSKIGDLEHHVNQLERDLCEARQAAKEPQSQVATLESKMNAVDGRNRELERIAGEEQMKRRAAEDEADNLKKKLDFNDKIHGDQMRKAEELLNQAKDHSKKLEDRINEAEKQNQSLPELLEKMRQQRDAELEAYKRDVEDTHRRNLAQMKAELDAARGTIQELRAANNNLHAETDKQRDKIRQLEGLIKDLQKQKAAHDDIVNNERARGADRVRALEKKLKELQDKLYQMMQDANKDKDAALSLRTEINNYTALLGEEEARLKTSLNPPAGTVLGRPQITSTFTPSNRLANVSSGNMNDRSKYMYSGDDASQAQSSMGVAGETGRPQFQPGSNKQLTEYTDKYRYQPIYKAGGPMTSRDLYGSQTMADGLPQIPGSRGNTGAYASVW